MQRLLASLIIFTQISLSSCAARIITECPIDIPDIWRKPLYEPLTAGFMDCNGAVCMSDADSKKIVKNQAICETIRRGLIDFVDDINGVR